MNSPRTENGAATMPSFSGRNLEVWRKSEADAYFRRNRQALASLEGSQDDSVVKLLLPFLRRGDRVVELGCCNGWRVRTLASKMPDLKLTAGFDLSFQALDDGTKRGS